MFFRNSFKYTNFFNFKLTKKITPEVFFISNFKNLNTYLILELFFTIRPYLKKETSNLFFVNLNQSNMSLFLFQKYNNLFFNEK